MSLKGYIGKYQCRPNGIIHQTHSFKWRCHGSAPIDTTISLSRAGVCECIHHHMSAARGSLPVYGTNIIPHNIFLDLLKHHTTAHLPDFLFTWKTIAIALSQQ